MNTGKLTAALDVNATAFNQQVERYRTDIVEQEVGRIRSLSQGIVWAEGLGRVKSEELVVLGGKTMGLVLDILPDRIGIVLLGSDNGLMSGDEVMRTGRVLEVPVDSGLIGRIINPLGMPLDGLGPVPDASQLPVQREAQPIIARAPVDTPLQTGIKVIDALIPIGRGQRELILGDRQIGKTTVAVDTILNQHDQGVICIYCAIGQRSSTIAKISAELKHHQAMQYTMMVVAEGNDPPGLQYIAPYAATSMAEYFMEQGEDVLIVYDDLTRHAQAYRQISLLLRRPPGREAYPGDIFYIHARLLERSTHLKAEFGGGSLTALPIIETEAQNISAYIPTNLISITDGQIYLSPDLFQKGVLPAIDVGKSVSRVGGKAQLAGYRKVAGDLRLSYSQFQELESFARFGTRLDAKTLQTLEHGKRVRAILKQHQSALLSAAEQLAVLWAVNNNLLDTIPVDTIHVAEERIVALIREKPALSQEIVSAGKGDQVWQQLLQTLADLLHDLTPTEETAAAAESAAYPSAVPQGSDDADA